MPSTPRLLSPLRPAALGLGLAGALVLVACGSEAELQVADGTGPSPQLPPPKTSLIPTVHTAKAVGWPAGVTPTGAPGTTVKAFADNLVHPRWLLVLPNGDVLVAETNAPPKPAESGFKSWAMKLVMGHVGAGVPSANRLTLLRDTDGDGVADVHRVYLSGLHSPFGMALVGHTLYIADTDAVVSVPYTPGETTNAHTPVKVADLPAGPRNHHWTKSLVAGPDGTLYAGIGSNSNAAENGIAAEEGRARVDAIDPATGTVTPYATGLRNPVGLAWAPSGQLWVAVNERDELGSDIVPDYMTGLKPGAFYGFPWSYYGNHVDSRVSPPDPAKVATAIAPDYALGPHTASLGLAWSPATADLPGGFRGGMVIGQHGSWNRKPFSGYEVAFVPFDPSGTRPAGPVADLLTGFVNADGEAYGRPVGVAFDRQGALLVADDVGNTIWRVSAPRG